MATEKALTIDQAVSNAGGIATVTDGDTLGVGEGVQASEADANLALRVGTTGTRVSARAISFAVGKATDVDLYLYADNGDATLPALRYQASGSKWQYSNDGTTFLDLGGGSLPAGATNQHLEYSGAWTAVNNLTLPAGDRSITVAGGAAGGMLQLVAGGSTTPNNDGGSIELVAGAGAGTGVNGDIRVGVELAGVPNATFIRIGKIESPNTNNQILVDTANYTTDINGLYGFGLSAQGDTFLVTDILWQHRDGGGGGGGNCTLRVMDAQVTLEDSSPLKLEGATGRNNASGTGYKGSLILLDGGIGGDSTLTDGTGGDGGGGDWYGGNGGSGDGEGNGGEGGTITLHAGNAGVTTGSGLDGGAGSIWLKPGYSPNATGQDGVVIVGNDGFADPYTYMLFHGGDGVYWPWSDVPGFRWDWANDKMQVYVGGLGAGTWEDVAGGSTLTGYTTGASAYSTALGVGTAAEGASGNYRTLIGAAAGAALNGAASVTFIGCGAGNSVTTGSNNTIVGVDAGGTITTQADNTIVGYNALTATTSAGSTVLGARAGEGATSTTGHHVIIGADALSDDTYLEDGQVFIGYRAGERYFGGGAGNTALGNNALRGSIDCISYAACYANVAIGESALANVDTAAENVAIGPLAGYSITDSIYCVLVGYASGASLTIGSSNVCVGENTLAGTSTGSNNVCVGVGASGGGGVATSDCSFVGYNAGYSVTGNGNTALGYNALATLMSGTNNVGIGKNCDTAAASTYNVAVGYAATASGSSYCIQIGRGTNATASRCQFGDVTYPLTCYGSGTWNSYSDLRLKKNVYALEPTDGLALITALRPVTYEVKTAADEYQARPRYGLIAQEVKAVCDQLGLGKRSVYDDTGEFWGMDYSQITAPLIAAVQDLARMVAELQTEVAALKASRG